MAKYRKITEIIDAESYEPGMEDGHQMIMNDDGSFNKLPYIVTRTGIDFLKPGDVIIREKDGKRYKMAGETFRKHFEMVME